MEQHISLEELLTKIEDIARILEDRMVEGDDLSEAQDLVDELRDVIQYKLD